MYYWPFERTGLRRRLHSSFPCLDEEAAGALDAPYLMGCCGDQASAFPFAVPAWIGLLGDHMLVFSAAALGAGTAGLFGLFF